MVASDSVRTVEASEDAVGSGTYHFLDVGGLKYGECTLVEFGRTRILIDGSHSKDFEGQAGYKSIPEQLQEILGGEPPYDLAMVVVTHCHADHVGCLPELFSKGIIRPKFALLTDPKWGFGRTETDDSSHDAADPRVRLSALLREEDASDLDDNELREFIDAAATVESRYADFVKDLRAGGVEVIAYRGKALPDRLLRLVKPTGLKLLGPTQEQLLFCAEQIATTNQEAEDAVDAALSRGDTDLVTLYRSIAEADADAQRNPRGNGMNCQSITFAFGPPEARVLLAGDMQFSEPGVEGMDAEMVALRRRVAEAGPYKLFKTTHHTSHNGQDEDFLTALGDPELIVHSGGLRDSSHPFPAVLRMLKRRDGIRFARTDRNGVITVKPHLPAVRAITVTRGELNDFSPNRSRDDLPQTTSTEARGTSTVQTPAAQAAGLQIVIVNLPNAPIDLTVSGVDIRIRPVGEAIPREVLSHDRRRASSSGPFIVPSPQTGSIAIGRSLDKILFVTDRKRLRDNVGELADQAIGAVERAGGMVQVSDGEGALDRTRQALTSDPTIKGVVLLGGYDVVPSARTDALGADLRRALGNRVRGDADQFWVWSDKLYGDKDGDSVAEFPVSRIPDAHDRKLFLSAVGAAPFKAAERFGIHNTARPFAPTIWPTSMGNRQMEESRPFLSTAVVPAHLEAACHYFMLHGAEQDGREFTGEDNGSYPVAFTAGNVPGSFSGVVFSGCCWGALIVDGAARQAVQSIPAPRPPEASIALSYLKAGAVAFIGCTGSHYSGPDPHLDTNYAARLHREFWYSLAQPGTAPSTALHEAKEKYLRWTLDQGARLDPLDTARRLKNFSQFTCLGMGW